MKAKRCPKAHHNSRARLGPPVDVKPVDQCSSLDEVFEYALPAFGGAILQRVYLILREVIQRKIPLVVTIAGPIGLSNQHRAWLLPLIERGWVAYLTVTDAICYHDGHDCLRKFRKRPIGRADLYADDAAYRKAHLIRVADTGFPEEILFDQDAMMSAVLQRPEFQKRMTTTERNNLLGRHYEAQERAFDVKPGLLSTCYRHGVPVFIGAPADGSGFLNSVKLWALRGTGRRGHKFDYDLHADVFESCAYHYWGLFDSDPKALAILILGGGVPKNYSLQPEPTLSQILRIARVRGYDYDVQIVSAPVTDGSLSSCEPSEAVSWGKIKPETYQQQTQSVQADYSMVMPFIVRALVENEALTTRPQLCLYARRGALVRNLKALVRQNRDILEQTLHFPLSLPS